MDLNSIRPQRMTLVGSAFVLAGALMFTSCAWPDRSNATSSSVTSTIEGYVDLLLQPEELPSLQFDRPTQNPISNCELSLARGASNPSTATLAVSNLIVCDSVQSASNRFRSLTQRNQWERQLGDRPDLVATLGADEADAWCYETDVKLIETDASTPTPYPKKICQIVVRYGRTVTRMGVNSDSGKPLSPSIDELAALMTKKSVEIKKMSQQLK